MENDNTFSSTGGSAIPISDSGAVAQSNPRIQAKSTGARCNNIHDFVKEHWQVIESVSWPTSAQAGSILWSREITPTKTTPHIEHLSRAYNTWSGGIDYAASVVSTAFLGGKFAMSFMPPTHPPTGAGWTAQDLSTFAYEVEDIKLQERVEFKSGDMNRMNFHYMPSSDAEYTDRDFIGGYAVLWVVNPVVTTGTSISSVTIQMYCRAPDLNFCGIVPINQSNPFLSLPTLRFLKSDVLMFGDLYYGAYAFTPASLPQAAKYLDCVRKTDGTWYTGRQLAYSANTPSIEGVVTKPSTYTVNNAGTLPRLTIDRNFLQYASDGTAGNNWVGFAKTTIDTTGVTVTPNLQSVVTAGVVLYVAAITPINSGSVTSFAFPSSLAFTPKGSNESFLLFLGQSRGSQTEFSNTNQFCHWQPLDLPYIPAGNALFGQFFDANKRALGFFKIYSQGFTTISAVTSNKAIAEELMFRPLALVDEAYNMPSPSATNELNLYMADMRAKDLRAQYPLGVIVPIPELTYSADDLKSLPSIV